MRADQPAPGTPTICGQEAQILLNRMADLLSYTYLTLKLPAIAACDSKDSTCPGIAPGGQFPNWGCNACKSEDEKNLLEYLPDNYKDLGEEDKADALKEAKDVWRGRSTVRRGAQLLRG